MEVVPLGKYMSEWVFNVFQLVDQVFFCAWSNNRYLLAAVRNCHGKNNSKSNISPTVLKQIGGIFDASSVVMLSVCIFHLEVESKVAYVFFQSCLSIIYIFQYLYTLCVSTQIIFTYVTYWFACTYTVYTYYSAFTYSIYIYLYAIMYIHMHVSSIHFVCTNNEDPWMDLPEALVFSCSWADWSDWMSSSHLYPFPGCFILGK